MKIATFNVNNVNKRLANLLDWLAMAQPDVACLQELKAEDRAFPLAAIEAAAMARCGAGSVPGTALRSSRGARRLMRLQGAAGRSLREDLQVSFGIRLNGSQGGSQSGP